jgi:hypothetical protein
MVWGHALSTCVVLVQLFGKTDQRAKRQKWPKTRESFCVEMGKQKYSYRAEGAKVFDHELRRRIQGKPADKHLVASSLDQGWFLAASGPSWAYRVVTL